MPPLPADFIHARACKLKCEKILTRPGLQTKVRKTVDTTTLPSGFIEIARPIYYGE